MKWCIKFIKTLANVTCATFYLIANRSYENREVWHDHTLE
jgi:hypothetical protein